MKEERRSIRCKSCLRGSFKCAKITLLIGVISFLLFIYIDNVDESACKNARHLYTYVELMGQEEEGDVEMVFDTHTGFQI